MPEAPTSVPPMMSAVLSRTKPVEAAARPVKAFRSEMTTGMSAPPIGRTSRTPKSRAPQEEQHHPDPRARSRRRGRRQPERARRRGAAFTTCWPGEGDRPARQELLQLAEGDQAAREARSSRSAPRRASRPIVSPETWPARRRDPVELRSGDERRRAAADAVEERHHLRHRGHLHERAETTPITVPTAMPTTISQ